MAGFNEHCDEHTRYIKTGNFLVTANSSRKIVYHGICVSLLDTAVGILHNTAANVQIIIEKCVCGRTELWHH